PFTATRSRVISVSLIITFSIYPSHPPSHSTSFPHTPPPTLIYTLSLHDALPISIGPVNAESGATESNLKQLLEIYKSPMAVVFSDRKSTSELQSRFDLVCRLLLEKKKKNEYIT